MRLVFLSDNLTFSGGRKLLLEYAAFLKKAGHNVEILVKDKKGALSNFIETRTVPDFGTGNIPKCDIIIATSADEVLSAWNSKKGQVVHFCQGFEITDLEQRLKGEILPSGYQIGWFSKLGTLRKRLSWKRKISEIDKIYRLQTHLITISPHLKTQLESRYGRKVFLCRNGVHTEFFYPDRLWQFRDFSQSHPLKIINVGPLDVSFKGIPVTFKAIELAKQKNLPIKFIRVSPLFSESERSRKIIDEFHENMPQKELGELSRNCDIYISNSSEGEGFGLPAMEALSSGLVSILSSISSYKSFSSSESFCLFVQQNSVQETVDAIERICSMSAEKFCEIRRNAIRTASDFSHEKACSEFERNLKDILKNNS